MTSISTRVRALTTIDLSTEDFTIISLSEAAMVFRRGRGTLSLVVSSLKRRALAPKESRRSEKTQNPRGLKIILASPILFKENPVKQIAGRSNIRMDLATCCILLIWTLLSLLLQKTLKTE
jgi:hypothetical protein